MFINVLICPSEPSANVTVPVVDVALITVIADVTFAVNDVETSADKVWAACYKHNQDGILLKTFSADTFLLIGVPDGSSTTWNKSTLANAVPKSVSAVTFLSAIFFSYINPYGNATLGNT